MNGPLIKSKKNCKYLHLCITMSGNKNRLETQISKLQCKMMHQFFPFFIKNKMMHPLIKSIIQKIKKKINNTVLSFLVLYVVVLQVFLGQGM
jgi:hypothetical protein